METPRYNKLEKDMTLSLTEEEVNEGWHFCNDWDDMLIHNTWPEFEACLCNRSTKEDNTMENQHQKITGYRELSQEEIDLMNE